MPIEKEHYVGEKTNESEKLNQPRQLIWFQEQLCPNPPSLDNETSKENNEDFTRQKQKQICKRLSKLQEQP